MLDKIKNKKIWILLLAIVLVLGVGLAILLSAGKDDDSKDSGKADESTSVESDEPYDGSGMEVFEDDTETEDDSIEVPQGSWDESDNEEQPDTENDNKEDSKKEDASDDNIQEDEIEWGTIF